MLAKYISPRFNNDNNKNNNNKSTEKTYRKFIIVNFSHSINMEVSEYEVYNFFRQQSSLILIVPSDFDNSFFQ